MSVHHSPSKNSSLGVSRRSSTTNPTMGTSKWFLAESISASVGFLALVSNLKLTSSLATDANAR